MNKRRQIFRMGLPEWILAGGGLVLEIAAWVWFHSCWNGQAPVTAAEKLHQLIPVEPVAFISTVIPALFVSACLMGLAWIFSCIYTTRRAWHFLRLYPFCAAVLALTAFMLVGAFNGHNYMWLLSDTHTHSLVSRGGGYVLMSSDSKAIQPDVAGDAIATDSYAAISARLPELASRWGYTPPPAQRPVYTSDLRWVYRLWCGCVGLQLLQCVRLPLYLLWRAHRKRTRAKQRMEPQGVLPQVRVNF